MVICNIIWGGFSEGPLFLTKDFQHDPILDEANAEFKTQHSSVQDTLDCSYDQIIESYNADMKSFLADKGISVQHSDYDYAMSEAMKVGDSTNLRKKMLQNIVKIRYFSMKDRQMVDRRGTLNQKLGNFKFDTEDLGRKRHKIPRSVFCYYDVDKHGWRTFRKANFGKIVKIEK